METTERPPLTPTVLFVEDHDDLREVTTYFLETMNFSVIACANAELASEAFRTRADIDLLLTDLQMPGRSGVELARELTALEPCLPVLMVSGGIPSSELLAEVQDRHWIFMSKPCRFTTLIAAMQDLLNANGRVHLRSSGASGSS